MNVDVTKPPGQRKSAMIGLIAQVVNDLDLNKNGIVYQNVSAFILHVGWHEGLELTKRRQVWGGPGRSFFQFKPPRAKEAVAYAKVKGWFDRLVKSSGKTGAEIEAGANALPSSGSTWPEDNPIESLLASDDQDLFATYLIRIALQKVLQAVPKPNDLQAVYWADRWKLVFASAEDRQEKINQFKANADAVDKLVVSLSRPS
jgi:hypothetical protein